MKLFVLPLFVAFCSVAAQTPGVTTLRTPDNGIQQQAAIDSKGVVHLIYFKGEPRAGDIFYVRRGPGQNEFSKPIQVNTQPHTVMAMGTIRGAQLALGKNDRAHVVWDGMGEGASAASHPDHGHDASHSHDASQSHDPSHGHDASVHSRPAHDASEANH